MENQRYSAIPVFTIFGVSSHIVVRSQHARGIRRATTQKQPDSNVEHHTTGCERCQRVGIRSMDSSVSLARRMPCTTAFPKALGTGLLTAAQTTVRPAMPVLWSIAPIALPIRIRARSPTQYRSPNTSAKHADYPR